MNLSEQQIEERALLSKQLFRDGMNCAQAVVGACCDLFGMDDRDTAMRMAAGFGGGMGRMRLTCGAASGMFMLAGLQNGTTTPHDNEGKMANYTLVQQLATQFRTNYGSLTCAELLGLAPRPADAPACRKEPCVEMVAEAVRIVLRSVN